MAEFLQVSLLDFIVMGEGLNKIPASQKMEILESHNELFYKRHMEDVMKLKDEKIECLEKLQNLYEEHGIQKK
ncbi:MAG TPA: hypothetical protein ENI20_08485 [Bacteroides sp.]|nr:hypothetical protein [Bacteroides sp.]